MSYSISQAVRELAEPKLAEFTAKLIPTVDPERILGVRMPALRKLARNTQLSPGSRSLIVPTAPIRPVYLR
jgi:oxidoreductase